MSLIQIAAFRQHQGDPLSFLICEEEDGIYTHIAIVKDRARNLISEAYMPHARERVLADGELAGIDVYDIEGLTEVQSAAILAECARREAAHEPYSITNLLRYSPVLRAIFGEASDSGSEHQPVICSQYAVDVVKAGGITLLNAPSYKVDPEHLTWATKLIPGQPLQPLSPAAPVTAPAPS